MKAIIVCTLLFGFSYAYDFDAPESVKGLNCSCGWRNSGRIIGGVETKKNEYPWMTAIQTRQDRYQFCGGAIITPRHILTAAHCSHTKKASELAVTVGAYDVQDFKEQNSQFIHVAEIINHPGYDKATSIDDIAILALASEIKFNKFVGPACFPNKKIFEDLVGQNLKVMGWGRYVSERANNDAVKKLREIDLQVVPLKECKKTWSNVRDSHTQICTYTPNKDTCRGDSGGPLVWLDPQTNRYTLMAAVSYGSTNCASPVPAVNTNVSAYLDWIYYWISATNKNAKTCSKK